VTLLFVDSRQNIYLV